MLSEFALTPDIFETWQDADLQERCFSQLKDLLLNDGFVRDLRNGRWSQYVKTRAGPLAGTRLLEALRERMRQSEATELAEPESSEEWLWEAQRSHDQSPTGQRLTSIRVSPSLTEHAAGIVTVVHRLHAKSWWQERSCSIRLKRTTKDYLEVMMPILLYSNSLMFIDPNLDPSKPNYSKFIDMLAEIQRCKSKPVVEIHRVCREGTGQGAKVLSRNEWITRFREFSKQIARRRISATVYIWDDFHDRYLLSNLIGISVPNGFDVSKKEEKTTWTRLSRTDRDDVQREFHPNATVHAFHCDPIRIGEGAPD